MCVFIELARRSLRLKPDTVLAAWLYQVTRRKVVDVARRETSRQQRRRIATEMNATNADSVDWANIEPLLDEAMGSSERSTVPPSCSATLKTNPCAKLVAHLA